MSYTRNELEGMTRPVLVATAIQNGIKLRETRTMKKQEIVDRILGTTSNPIKTQAETKAKKCLQIARILLGRGMPHELEDLALGLMDLRDEVVEKALGDGYRSPPLYSLKNVWGVDGIAHVLTDPSLCWYQGQPPFSSEDDLLDDDPPIFLVRDNATKEVIGLCQPTPWHTFKWSIPGAEVLGMVAPMPDSPYWDVSWEYLQVDIPE
jgi:hypothetical protein